MLCFSIYNFVTLQCIYSLLGVIVSVLPEQVTDTQLTLVEILVILLVFVEFSPVATKNTTLSNMFPLATLFTVTK